MKYLDGGMLVAMEMTNIKNVKVKKVKNGLFLENIKSKSNVKKKSKILFAKKN
jgi:hypothetical protein